MIKTRIERENDNTYLNIVFNGSVPTYNTNPAIAPTGEQPMQATYNVTKTTPILDKASDYYCSIIRFDIPLESIPILIMPIIPNQGNPNLSPLIIGINYAGTKYPVYVTFYPDNSLTPPVQNQPTQVITPYYYIYSYQQMINMFNIALSQAYTASGLAALFPTVQPPFFFYDPVTELISLVVNSLFTTVTSPATALPLIYINNASMHYLGSFDYYFNGFNQASGYDYIFILNNTNPINPSPPTPPQVLPSPNQIYTPLTTMTLTYYQYTESYSTIQYWFSLRKLLILTNSIPIPIEYVPATNDTGLNVGMPIFTDFVPNLQQAGDSRSIAYYQPSAQYRLVNLIGDLPLQKVDLSVYWEDVLGNIYPVYIPQNNQGSVKIGFFKKSLYKGSTLLIK
jgi:hypothetical protein